MILIVGLGNPGRKFKKTRHNTGFRVIEDFRKENNFPKFKSSKKFESLISKGSLNRKKVILAKPQTFMNNSGQAVKVLTDSYKITPPGLIVVHDDIDLPLGKIRISKARGAAGHKGVQSIINELDTKDFIRFRIGIKSKICNLKPKTLERFVLKKFKKKEEKIVKESIKKTVKIIEITLREGIEKAMQKI